LARATTIVLSGPFFEKDPAKTLSQNVQTMLEAVAQEGESDVKAQAAGHQRTGAFYNGIEGRVRSVSGKHWLRTAVVSETHVYPWPNGGAKQYRGGKLEAHYHMFRTTASRLRRSRAVNQAELTKGMN
jgi:hypothetical protein